MDGRESRKKLRKGKEEERMIKMEKIVYSRKSVCNTTSSEDSLSDDNVEDRFPPAVSTTSTSTSTDRSKRPKYSAVMTSAVAGALDRAKITGKKRHFCHWSVGTTYQVSVFQDALFVENACNL